VKNQTTDLRLITTTAGVLLFVLSGNSYGNSVNVSYGQLKQHVSFSDEAVTLKPIGPSVSLSFDLSDEWSLDLDYHNWQDDLTVNNNFTADSDLKTISTSVNYYKDSWSFSGSYSDSTDDTELVSVRRPTKKYSTEKTASKSFGGSVGYGWVSGNLFYNFSFGAQLSDWDSNMVQANTPVNPPPPPEPPPGGGGQGQPPPPPPEPQTNISTEVNSGDSTSASTSVSIARYWSLSEDTGVLLGTLLSWNYVLSGDSVLVSQTGRGINQPPPQPNAPPGGGGQNINRAGNNGISSISGDDNYGQLSFYISYDLTSSWSIDLDTGFDIGTDENDQIWSLSLGYFF
jgi:hypothetical protein